MKLDRVRLIHLFGRSRVLKSVEQIRNNQLERAVDRKVTKISA